MFTIFLFISLITFTSPLLSRPASPAISLESRLINHSLHLFVQFITPSRYYDYINVVQKLDLTPVTNSQYLPTAHRVVIGHTIILISDDRWTCL